VSSHVSYPWVHMWFSEQNRCIGDDTKAVARRSKKCIRKAKNTYVEHGYLAHCRNSVKNCLLALKLTEIWQSAAEIWPKTIFKMAVVGHLDFFLNGIFGHVTVTEFYVCCCVPNCIKIGCFFVEI